MTFEKILDGLSSNKMTPEEGYKETESKIKTINYYAHIGDVTSEPLNDSQLQELNAIVEILHILYNSKVDSPVSDTDYESLHELLIDMGIPRVSGNVNLTSDTKVSHKYKNLRGTIGKVHYLYPTEKRSNKSRKYLDEWIKKMEALYESKTGKKIDLNKVKVIIQPKFDGVSSILEKDDIMKWISRGDTRNNLAQDVTHIMDIFNESFEDVENETGIKFEVMCSEFNKDQINEIYKHHPYKNSRQIVIATLNSLEPDFKAEFLYPVPLRIMKPGDEIESVHPDLIRDFPTVVCTFGDRDIIRDFANRHKYIEYKGHQLRTDGAVITILDKEICKVLGRENNINNFEVAYKFTEETAYSKVKDIEFYLSEFGYVTPVLVINDLIMKGNTVNHISLSNKERFDELNLQYGDEVKVMYDIIPYTTIDEKCQRVKNGRKIEFIKECPRCHEPLDLGPKVIRVRCHNPNCPSRLVGRVYNYCRNLRIQHLGFRTLDMLFTVGLLDDGILSLYKLKKKTHLVEDLEGFGKLRTKKIVKEIEAKRRLRDADFFGSLGIDNVSIKTFESIFSNIRYTDFMNMIKVKNWDLLRSNLIKVDGIGPVTVNQILNYLKDPKTTKDLKKLMREVRISESYAGGQVFKGRITFTGCRPEPEIVEWLRRNDWRATDAWSDKDTKYLVIPKDDYESSKVNKAHDMNIPIIVLGDGSQVDKISAAIPNLL